MSACRPKVSAQATAPGRHTIFLIALAALAALSVYASWLAWAIADCAIRAATDREVQADAGRPNPQPRGRTSPPCTQGKR